MADPYGDDSYEATLAQMAQAGAIPIEQARLMAAMRRAQANVIPTPQGREVGRTYVASSPLEHLASAMSKVWANRDMQQAEAGFGALEKQAQAAGEARLRMDRAPAPAGWGAPAGMTRGEALKVLPTILKERKAAVAVPDATLIRATERHGLSGEEADALRADPDLASKLAYEKAPAALPSRPTAEQIARGAKFGLRPAENEDSQHFEVAIRTAEGAARDRTEKDAAATRKGADDAFDKELKLADKFAQSQVYKDADAIKSAHARIEAAPADGSGDLALITMYMKMIDPTTGVKEQEFQNAAKSMGLWEKLQGWGKQVEGTGRLTDQSRAQFKAAAATLKEAAKAAYYREARKARERAGRYSGVNPDNVAFKFDEDDPDSVWSGKRTETSPDRKPASDTAALRREYGL